MVEKGERNDLSYWREQALIACAEVCRKDERGAQCHASKAQHGADAVVERIVKPLLELQDL